MFVELVKLFTPHSLPVPIGSAEKVGTDASGNMYIDEVLVMESLKTRVLCSYQQDLDDLCLGYAVASALKYMGYERVAGMMAGEAKQWSFLPGDMSLLRISSMIQDEIPEFGNFKIFNKGRHNGKKAKLMSAEDIVENKTRYLKLVVPVCNSGLVDHAIAVVDDLIFDTRINYALKLTVHALHVVCGRRGIHDLGQVYVYYGQFRTKKKYIREMGWNW